MRAFTVRGARVAAGAAALLACLAPSARAQFSYLPTPDAARCLAAIPAAQRHRVPVVVTPSIGDATLAPLAAPLALAVEDALDLARTAAGLPGDSVPAAEPTLTWQSLDHDLLVTLRRSGPPAWRPDDVTGGLLTGDGGARWLADVLARAHAAGRFLVPWPDGLRRDSAVVRLAFRRPYVTPSGRTMPVNATAPVTVFTVLVPDETPARATRPPRPRYPEALLRTRQAGRVLMQFVVDTTGRPIPESLRDTWPVELARPMHPHDPAYVEFTGNVRAALDGSRYEPALVGGCRVPMVVQQEFTFAVR